MISEVICFSFGMRSCLSIGIVTFCSKLAILVLLRALDVNGNNFDVTVALDVDALVVPNGRVVPDVAVR